MRLTGRGSRERGESPPATPQDETRRVPRWPAFGPRGYLGQLSPTFQRALAEERQDLRPADCEFYHCMTLPDGTNIDGPWDLRGRENDYMGGVDLHDKRVLELGPSSGYLTFYMERQGADVVCFDVGYDLSIDLLPAPGGESRQLRADHAATVTRFQNSWWYLHERVGSQARMVYGDIYALPGDMGEFDVAAFGNILLHLRSPIAALEEASRRTTDCIVVTETWPYGSDTLHDNIMRIFPSGEAGRWVIWWAISAGAVVEMLKMIGFGSIDVVEHTQLHQPGHTGAFVEVPMYTVVGRRR